MTSLLTLLMAAVIEITCPMKKATTEVTSPQVEIMENSFEYMSDIPYNFKVLRNNPC